MKLTVKSYYAPCIEYFHLIAKAKKITIDINENYQKQSYRNRCYISNSQGIQKLIVPTINSHKKTIIKDIKIDNKVLWNKVHWKSIATAYGKAPYFIHYENQIAKLYNKKFTFLIDLNLSFIELFLKILKITIPISFTSQYNNSAISLDLPKKSFLDDEKAQGNENSLLVNPKLKIDVEIEKESDPSVSQSFFPKYQQVFGKKFIPNLSIIDALMSSRPHLNT